MPEATNQHVAQTPPSAADIVECVEFKIDAVPRVLHCVEHGWKGLGSITQQINAVAVDWRHPVDIPLHQHVAILEIGTAGDVPVPGAIVGSLVQPARRMQRAIRRRQSEPMRSVPGKRLR